MTVVGAIGATAYLVVGVGSYWCIGERLGARLFPTQDRWARALATMAIGVVAAEVVLQILGALGLLTPWVVAVTELVAAAGIRWRLPPAPPLEPRARLTRREIAVIAGSTVVVAIALAISINGPSLEFDTRRYHIVNAAQWLNAHQTWTLPYAQPGNHTAADPGNAELLGTWGMLATHDDTLAYLPNLLFAGVLIVAAAVFARSRGKHPALAVGAVLGVLGSVEVLPSQLHSLTSDLAVAAPVLAAIVLYSVAPRHLLPRTAVGLGAILGVAVGAKYGGLVTGIGLVAAVKVATRQWKSAAWVTIGVIVTGSFWYLRNLVATGNPIYPQGVSVGSHTLLAGNPSPTIPGNDVSLASQILHGNIDMMGTWFSLMWTVFGPLLLLMVAGLTAGWRPQTRALTVSGLIAFVVYAFLPRTGGGTPGGAFFSLGTSSRYLIPAAIVLVIVGAMELPSRIAAAVVGLAVVHDAMGLAGLPARPDLVPPIGLALVALVPACSVCALIASRRAGIRILSGLAVAAGLVSFIALTPRPPITDVSVALEGHGRIAVVAVSDMRSVLGPSLDVPVISVGNGSTEGARTAITNPTEFTAKITALHVQRVVVGKDDSDLPLPSWTPPASWRILAQENGITVYEP